MKIWGVIPARWGSTRLGGKLLKPIAGKPLILRVWENVMQAELLDGVIIATDDERIANIVERSGADVMMTPPGFKCGTERVAYVAERLSADYFVDVQGDELFVEGWMIDRLIADAKETKPEMATIAAPLLAESEYRDPHTVKVVCDRDGNALYFSRSPIPFLQKSDVNRLKHIGVYLYRDDVLKRLAELPVSPLEHAESLEQLRALENGIPIRCVVVDEAAALFAVNTEADLVRAEQLLSRKG